MHRCGFSIQWIGDASMDKQSVDLQMNGWMDEGMDARLIDGWMCGDQN